MKRLHVHVGVENLDSSIGFYSTLFGSEPTVVKTDYAKWMLEDPRVNFAISSGQHAAKGIEHLGIQVESPAELTEVYGRLEAADRPVLAEGATTCCYAKSEKSWIADPDGIVWEAFFTNGEATVYGDSPGLSALSGNAPDTACCAPALPAQAPAAERAAADCCDETTPQGVCCEPKAELPADAPCCGAK
jgi:catechol 2,3-dioxygenase-like lactoylglutathione lyase family enzyme